MYPKVFKDVAQTALIATVLLLSGSETFADDGVRENERLVDLTYQFRIKNLPPDRKRLFAWVPVPASNKWQTLEDFDVEGDWPFTIVKEPEFGNRFIRFDFSETADKPEIAVTIRFHARRKSFHLLHESQSGETMSSSERALFLSADRLIPTSGKIAEEAKTVAGKEQDRLKQARRLYDHIVETVKYDKSESGWGRGDALYACDIRKGNCTDFHSLFIGEARSLEVPARFIMGVPIPDDRVSGTIAGYHCWAEFYIDDKGWVPIDASEANKFPDKKEKLFGGLDENRIQFTIGRDIQLPLAESGPVNYIIYPHVELNGEAFEAVETTFGFRKL